MMSDPIIKIDGLGKRYRIGQREAQPHTLREALSRVVSAPFAYWRQMSRPPSEAETLWALRDVSTRVYPGEAMGVVGRNGSGKSTLLKVLSRITEPTEGRAVVRGRVGSLLEVGTGFHPELTGRENVFLNGTILGMNRQEIARKFDEIVAFSEIERFIDTPVKRYSSGMYVRLAFSVAAHLDSEILILDEVLAVGDVAFRKKCQDKMTQVGQSGRTILFVSHSMASVRRLCQRAIWLHDSHVQADGPVETVLGAYLEFMNQATAAANGGDASSLEEDVVSIASAPGSGLNITKVVLKNDAGQATREFAPGTAMTVEIHYRADIRIDEPYVWLAIDSIQGACFSANMLLDGHRPELLDGTGVLACRFEALPLLPRQGYAIRLAVRSHDGRSGLIEPQEAAFFRVQGNPQDYGLGGDLASELTSRSIAVMVPYTWILPDGTRQPTQLAASNPAAAQPV